LHVLMRRRPEQSTFSSTSTARVPPVPTSMPMILRVILAHSSRLSKFRVRSSVLSLRWARGGKTPIPGSVLLPHGRLWKRR
jgi:hypothetical protein